MEELENQNQTQNPPQNEASVVAAQSKVVPKKDKRRHFLAAFFLSFMWGIFGIDRFYLGKIWTGLLKLLTFGGFGIWAIVDLTMIMSGSMRDKQGNELIDAARYKRFASWTVLIFALVLGATILLSGISVIYAVDQFMQNGGIEKLMPSSTNGTQAPNLNQPKDLNLNSLNGIKL